LLMLTINNEAAPPGMIVMMVGITLVGILGLAASIAGFAFKSLSFPLRSVLLVLSLLVFFTRWQDWQIAVQLAAAGLILVLMAVNFSAARTART